MRRYRIFRGCMLVGAAALVTVALYYFINYVLVLDAALGNSSVRAGLQASIRALWLAFGFQAMLIGLLYALVAFRPPALSREVIVLLGMLQLLEAVLLFTFAGNLWMALLLVAAAAFVLVGAVLWPTDWPIHAAPHSDPAPPRPAPGTRLAAAPEPDTAPDLPPPADPSFPPDSKPGPPR